MKPNKTRPAVFFQIAQRSMAQSINRARIIGFRMTETTVVEKRISPWRLRLMGIVGMGLALVGSASALTLNTTISDLIYSVVDLIPSILNLVIGMAPVIITVALVGALVAFLAKVFKFSGM